MHFQGMAKFGLLVVSAMASLFQLGSPAKQWNFTEIPPSTSLNWYPCFRNFFCAVLDVPLDYSKKTPDRAFVPIVKYAATASPYKGMVLTNPGGPGGSGVSFLVHNVNLLLPVVGSNYDLVSWEPRGVGYSIPAANCTLPASLTGLQRRTLDKIYGPEIPSALFDDAFQEAKVLGAACEASIGGSSQAGPHMTTATTAHDMKSILDAFKKTTNGKKCRGASLLNYWGFSYGTVLGQTFASMFPERVGRLVLDGVVNPDTYLGGLDLLDISLVDNVFSTFFLYCSLAGPSKCAFATGSTPHDVYLRFEAILGRLNASYAIEQGWSNATVIEATLVGLKQLAFSFSYEPISSFPLAAELLVQLEAILPNLTAENLAQLEASAGITNTGLDVSALWQRAIRCSDTKGVLFNRTLQQWEGIIQDLEKTSYLAGELWTLFGIQCTGWPITSDYVFSGPFGEKTKNPILFVSNTLDPVTPIMNGQNGARIFKESQLLTIEGTGHTSNAAKNKCGFTKISKFLQTGQLPGKDNFCSLETGPFNVSYSGPLTKRADWT